MIYDENIRICQLCNIIPTPNTSCEVWMHKDYKHKKAIEKVRKCNIYSNFVDTNNIVTPIYSGSIKMLMYTARLCDYRVREINIQGILRKKYIIVVEEPFNIDGLLTHKQICSSLKKYTDLNWDVLPSHVVNEDIKLTLSHVKNILYEKNVFYYDNSTCCSETSILFVENITLDMIIHKIYRQDFLDATRSLYYYFSRNIDIPDTMNFAEHTLCRLMIKILLHEIDKATEGADNSCTEQY